MLNGAQIVIKELINQGVDVVFGYPGGFVLNIYDELYKNADKINHVITAHEQGAAHAADGYARASGKTGVVIATSGPGATNLVTGIANAYLDSVPMVAITGNVPLHLLGRDSFQEVDIVSITQSIVKKNYIVRDVTKLQETIREAFEIANEGRKGPVLIDIPKNIQAEMCEYIDMPPQKSEAPAKTYDIAEALELINSSRKPFIYAGGGLINAGAEELALQLSKHIDAPIGLSMMGLSAIPASYSLNLGMCGMHGKYASSMASANADLVIALGVRFSDRATGCTTEYARGRKILHIEIDESEIGKNVESIGLHGDLKQILTQLLQALPQRENKEWHAEIEKYKQQENVAYAEGFTPKNIIELVNAQMGSSAIVATDVGQHQMWTMQYYKFEKPRTLLTSGGLGTMGYGMGAAIGGCIASGRKRAVLFTSDGSFGMNLNELATAVSQRLPLVIVLLNNGVLGMVRQWQTMFYDKRYSQTTLERKTDFAALARSFGANGYRATSMSELSDILENLNDTPAVIDCIIGMDEFVLPMIPPGGSVKDIVTENTILRN